MLPQEWWHVCDHEAFIQRLDIHLSDDDACSICDFVLNHEALASSEATEETHLRGTLLGSMLEIPFALDMLHERDARGPPMMT